MVYHLGDHLRFRTPNGESLGRIQSFYREGDQNGPVVSEVRPLRSIPNKGLVACTNLVSVSPDNFIELVDILPIR